MSVIETKVKTVVNTQNNTVVIHNQKFPNKPDLIKDKFFDYDIYHVSVDGVEMYAVTDLLKQYTKNHTVGSVRINNYLRLDSTKQYISVLYNKYCDLNKLSSFQNISLQNDFLEDDSDNSHLQKNINEHDNPSVIENNENKAENNITIIDKPGVIIRFSFDGYGLTNVKNTILMCEKLLIQCLMWFDVSFADDIFDFIEKLRHQDNDFLKHNLEIVEIENNELKLMTQKQTQLISDIQSKNDELNSKNKELEVVNTSLDTKVKELEVVNTSLDSKNKELETTVDILNSKTKELSKINSTLESKNASLVKINSKLNTKINELNKINSEINSKINYLHRINSDLITKNKELENIISTLNAKTNELNATNKDLENTLIMLKQKQSELELVIADKIKVIEDLSQASLEYEKKCKELENKLKELESINECINQAKNELERLTQNLKIRVAELEPRQVIDTCKTNWTLYFAKRNLFLKNNRSLYIHVSFGYRNQRDIPKIIKDNIIYCIKNCPNGQVSRQDTVKQAYEQLRQCHAEYCNCKENEYYKFLYTVEFRLDLFCTKTSYNTYKQRIRDALTVYNEAALTEYLLQLQPKLSILETLENICEDIVESNNWYDSSCQRYY